MSDAIRRLMTPVGGSDRPEWRIAAQWWSANLVPEVCDERRQQVFYRNLLDLLEQESLNAVGIVLQTDYQALGLLGKAVKLAALDVWRSLPSKTSMLIKPNSVMVYRQIALPIQVWPIGPRRHDDGNGEPGRQRFQRRKSDHYPGSRSPKAEE